MNVWRLSWQVSQHHRRSFWLGWLLFVVFFTLPAAIGWILARCFDALERGDTGAVVSWVVALVIVEAIRMAVVHAGAIVFTRCWVHMQSFLRANLLAAQMSSGGPEAGRPVASAGEAITHFRDDTEDVAQLVDGMIDVSGAVTFTVVAAFVLGSADAGAAAILIAPLLAIAAFTRVLDTRIKAARAADRAATSDVTGFVGDVMAGSTTVRVNHAVEPVLVRLRSLVDVRRGTAVRDRVLDEGVQAFSRGAADVGLGLVLLVGASSIADGSFGVGDLALFTAYLGWLSFLPRITGRVLARRKQTAVAFDRMRRLVADDDAGNTVLPRSLPIGPRDERVRPTSTRPERIPLDRFEAVGLSARHPSGAGVFDVDLTIRRGDFVVVTGPIGSGKSTLLRALLGLAWNTDVSGRLLWNGVEIEDPGAFLVPPQAAFLPQVPQLVSDSVAENISFGDRDREAVRRAARTAVMDRDLAEMPAGLDTVIGPRGLRLSGGQRQRLAAARALVHRPELVVLDDVSSALDVTTEIALWDGLAMSGATTLAVSHRAVAFERATRVIHLDAGRIA
ncbi:MAG: ABC transporter ATP-binding protein, partial [Actinomycetota bacterium]